MNLEQLINKLYDKDGGYSSEDYRLFSDFILKLNKGEIRAAEKIGDEWITNIWVKKGILSGFRMGKNIEMAWSDNKKFVDKDTYPEKTILLTDAIRVVPGGSSIRNGCYVGKRVTLMPPAFINVGAYVDEGTMIDSHALIGSCAQIGKNVHVSAAAIIGGVLEPIGNNPVIIEDDVFIGGNTGLYEGVIVRKSAIIGAGVVITSAIKIYDSVNHNFLTKQDTKPLTIPEGSVVVSGTRLLNKDKGIAIYCPIIIKYRDSKTEESVTLEKNLR